MPYSNFSYVKPGVLAGSAHPLRWGKPLAQVLAWLADEGIQAVVSLDEAGLDPATVQEFEMVYLHSPVTDFSVPSPAQALSVVNFIDDCAIQQMPVVVHCAAGIGRTGTLLACWFVKQGMAPDKAIDHVRRKRPGSIETLEQEDFIHEFAELLSKQGE